MNGKRLWIAPAAAIVLWMTHGVAHAAEADIQHGRYMVVAGHCNNCHTVGFAAKQGNLPETEWLLGNPVGYRTPAGTSYASNLRLTTQNFTEDEWVKYIKTAQTRPPHPWWSLQPLTEKDLRAMHKYIRHLGPAGKMMPAFVPPEKEPAPPYEIRQVVR
jgi:mono/diheme cytochrome c family protein